MDKDDIYLTSAQLKRRYGNATDMSVWRWLRNPKIDFPQPIVIGARLSLPQTSSS